MLLALDVGNTDIVLAIIKNDDTLMFKNRIPTNRYANKKELIKILGESIINSGIDITGVIIASVVPPIMSSLIDSIRELMNIEPLIVTHKLDLGIKIMYNNPAEVGADRLVNVVAARNIYRKACIVVDFGTATTYCCIDREGRYLGGAISLGIGATARSLYEKTAKLPNIELRLPKYVIAKNTIENIQSGVIIGYIGQVKYLIDKMKYEMGDNDTKVIATGGLSEILKENIEEIEIVEKDLTLKGLKIIYDRNK